MRLYILYIINSIILFIIEEKDKIITPKIRFPDFENLLLKFNI